MMRKIHQVQIWMMNMEQDMAVPSCLKAHIISFMYKISHLTTAWYNWHDYMSNTHTTHTQPFYCSSGICPGPPGWAGTRKVKTNLDLLEQEIVSGSGICWVYASLHLIPDNHANIPPLSFLQAGCHSCRPTNSVKALKRSCDLSR